MGVKMLQKFGILKMVINAKIIHRLDSAVFYRVFARYYMGNQEFLQVIKIRKGRHMPAWVKLFYLL